MTLKLDKSSRNKKKEPKPIKETKPATPEKKFDFSKFKKQEEAKRAEEEKKTDDTEKKRKRGRPSKNKVYKILRVSDEALDIVNAYKQAAQLSSQDDAIIKGLVEYSKGNMPYSEKRVFDVLLEAKGLSHLLEED